jgi:predicted CoA-binding protein
MQPTIAIIGASSQRSKFGNKAVRAYLRQGYRVFPVHPSAAFIEGLPACRSIRDIPAAELDRVSIYLPPAIGLQVIEEVADKPCREVWLNPGAESAALVERARALGLNIVLGCSVVDIGVNPHDLD